MKDIKMYYATNNAKLYGVICVTDAQSMSRWVEEILNHHADVIRCGNYQSVFLCKDLDDKNMLIGAAGRFVGMRVLVSRSEIKGQLDLNSETIFTTVKPAEKSFESTPFKQIFALCNELRDKLKEKIGPKFYGVPFVGGLKSIILSDEPQEIINYYLPEVELFGTENDFNLFCVENIPEQISLPAAPKAEVYTLRPISSKVQYPDKYEYMVRMDKVLEKLKADFVQKVVVSRKCTVKTKDTFDRLDYTAYMLDRYYQEYFYLFRQGGNEYWAGISPEIIMKQRGGIAVTKPLAGTRKKYDDEALNEQMRQELHTTSKDISEHEHALYFMVNQLEKADIGKVTIDKNKVLLETPYTFHIKSEISVKLKDNVGCFDIIDAIYPPATIWGIPVDRTEHILAETEPFQREYFTGLYGYWDFLGNADTALIIRSAKLAENEVSVYAGGGIVKDSDPNSEFEETVNKMRPLLNYFVEN